MPFRSDLAGKILLGRLEDYDISWLERFNAKEGLQVEQTSKHFKVGLSAVMLTITTPEMHFVGDSSF